MSIDKLFMIENAKRRNQILFSLVSPGVTKKHEGKGVIAITFLDCFWLRAWAETYMNNFGALPKELITAK